MRHFPEYAGLLLAILLLLFFAWWAWIPSGRLPRHRVRHHRLRLRLRLHPGRGHATVFELWLRWGRWAAFRHSGQTRRLLTFWQRVTAGAWAYSVVIGRGHYRHGLRIPLDEHVLVFSPPRQGKSGWLGRVIVHYPGPVVSTTTKADMYELTSVVRAQLGSVHVFNPQGIGGVPSTFAWNVIQGCREPQVAIRRADAFAEAVSQKGVEEASFWAAKASDYLRAVFCAADLADGDMRLVARWVLTGNTVEAEAILASHGTTYEQWAAVLTEMRSEARKTTATIKMTISRALSFMADPALAAAVLPRPGQGLDIEAFTRSRGTLYLIAESRGDESPVAALFACLCNEVHYIGTLIGSQSPAGRIDPPLLLALDEVTQICPVPVPSWLADSAGKGVQVVVVAHGEAQLRARWGQDGARVTMDTSGVKVFLRGITDTGTLEMASKLCGQTALKEHGKDEHSRHPVMTEAMVSQLPTRFALVIRSGFSPVVASLKMVWRDRLYRRARRATSTVARATSAEALAAERRAIERAREQLSRPAPGATTSTGEPPEPPADGDAWPWNTS